MPYGDCPAVIRLGCDQMLMQDTNDYFVWLHDVGFACCKLIGDDLYVGIKPLMFHWTMIVGEVGDRRTYADRWCYADQATAMIGFADWNGEGEPTGWHRHPNTGRRRPHGDASKEYIEW